MNIQEVLSAYDAMFGSRSTDEIESFLQENIRQAEGEGDTPSLLSLLNELMGLCRDTGKRDLGLDCAGRLLALIQQLALGDTVPHGTALLNVANAYRAFGLTEASQSLYRETETIYHRCLPEHSRLYASLYNNWSLLFQAQGLYHEAISCLEKALAVIRLYPKAAIEQATSLTNLASVLLQLPREERQRPRALKLLEQALELFQKEGGDDYHYSAALAAMGQALYLDGHCSESARYYQMAMEQLERHVGRNETWRQMEQNYKEAQRRANEP